MKGSDYYQYTILPSALGFLGLVSFQEQLCLLLIGKSEKALLAKMKDRIGLLPIHHPASFKKWEAQLTRYFSGERISFNLPICFLSGTDLQKKIWSVLREIPYGTVESYQAVGNRLGLSRHARVIGNACRENPLPVIIPCHRVVKSDGSLGGYNGGTTPARGATPASGIAIKKKLLAVERIVLQPKQ